MCYSVILYNSYAKILSPLEPKSMRTGTTDVLVNVKPAL